MEDTQTDSQATETSEPSETFEEGIAYQPVGEDGSLAVHLEGYDGPLHVLLTLARTQKVDLREISILTLAEQYLDFIRQAQDLRIELAADYLVMASWLAYLKSRLLLPPPHDDEEINAEEMAARLVFRLQCLEAMRDASAKLMTRDLLGRDVFLHVVNRKAFASSAKANMTPICMRCWQHIRRSVCAIIMKAGRLPKWMC